MLFLCVPDYSSHLAYTRHATCSVFDVGVPAAGAPLPLVIYSLLHHRARRRHVILGFYMYSFISLCPARDHSNSNGSGAGL